ncbi:MAG: hypothetical protein HND44_06615 [Chloroflexi bacterium]|nr:hypothetical protein [Ardenticatenaceae bacterium]MBL1128162.1 hypothetical protein [Chloroflexota bacterium]NOG34235.1 hypothetical protein [Chloroflexota bacterium]GIK56349.1 MAG: hypothetical protein BroJett015_20120 [Chloroflexota bacterium]
MSDKEQLPDSQLFTVRVWLEGEVDGQPQWRGKLRHVPSGEIRHFRGWAALIPLMLDMLRRYPGQNFTGYNKESRDEK